MKDSFIFYNDFFEILFALDDSGRTEILRAIQAHTQELQYTLSGALAVVFIPIRQKLDKDNIKYREICRARSNAGRKGGRPVKPGQPAGINQDGKKQKLSPQAKKADSEYECDNELLSTYIDNNLKKENISSEEEIKEKEFSEKFNAIKAELLNSPGWIETMKKNHRIPDGEIQNALQQFHDHIVGIGKEPSLTTVSAAKMWFNSWAAKGYLHHGQDPALGVGEFVKNGKRLFRWGKECREVPFEAPPRPSGSDYWSNDKQCWFFAED